MKYGKISIVGKPNVGKSTLINSIFKKEVVISTKKPQTTRNMIEISYRDDENLITFIDTPGLHKPKNKLDLFLNSQVKKALKNSDLTLFIIDLSRPIDDEDYECLKVLKDFDVQNVILILNKKDIVDQSKIDLYKEELNKKFQFINDLSISANSDDDVQNLMKFIESKIQKYEGDILDIDLLTKEIDDKFFISEIIRSLIIKNYRQEIPYGVAIIIDDMNYDNSKNMLSIVYSIIVEKESQKPIIIGKNGSAIKKLNISIREELLKHYDCKIFTKNEVKVKKDWRNNDLKIKELGYKK